MLKKIALILPIICILPSCGSDSKDTNEVESIVGTWSYIYASNSCKETYTFNSNGTWNGLSLDEIQSGAYTFDETVNEGERNLLSLSITSDNGLPNCNGISSDDTGSSGIAYVEFKNVSVMEWYADLTGGSALAVLTKE